MKTSEFSFILKSSSLGGIGVFAVHDIAKGVPVFKPSSFRILKIKDLPQDFLKYVVYLDDEKCLGPAQFDRMEIGWYLNHSDIPNIAKMKPIKAEDIEHSLDTQSFYTLIDIKAGDEIVIDYNYLQEPEHLKEDYYKNNKV